MNSKNLILFLFLLLPIQLLWGQTEKSFPKLKWQNANINNDDESRFGYETGSFTPIFKDCRNLPKTDPCYIGDEDLDPYYLLGQYKNDSMTEYVNIIYTPGPSMDPEFIITDKNNKPIWSMLAEEMCINSAGVIYTSGHMNKMFNQRAKFQLAKGEVTEILQPFYYVDVKGKLLKPVKLYSQKNNCGELIAALPVGYEIEVLLAEPETDSDKTMMNYLARTSFGLVGWLTLSENDTYHLDPIVKGLGFQGD